MDHLYKNTYTISFCGIGLPPRVETFGRTALPSCATSRWACFVDPAGPSTRLRIVSRQSTRKGFPSMDDDESLSHSKWERKGGPQEPGVRVSDPLQPL